MELFIAAIFGLLGGITRACVGLLKYSVPKPQGRFSPGALLFTLVASGMIGVFCSLLVGGNYQLSLLAGYAGTDLIENIYKIKKKQGTLI